MEAMQDKGIERYFIEKVSAKDMNRAELASLLEFCREGDEIYIHDLSRLARNVADLLAIIRQLEEKHVALKSNKESIDTSTATGKLLIVMIAAINEFERNVLKERQLEGIAIAKAAKVYTGRKRIKKPANWEEVYLKYSNRQLSAKKSMEILGLKANVFYKFVSEQKMLSASGSGMSIGLEV